MNMRIPRKVQKFAIDFRRISFLVFCLVYPVSSQSVWTQQQSGVEDTLLNVKAVNENDVWVSGTGGCVLRTVDGGSSWEKRFTPLRAFDNVCVEPLDSSIAWVVSIDASSGTDFRIFKTSDGGRNWKQVFRTLHTFGDAVRFFDRDDGIALGDPYPGARFNVYTTSDGGENWTRVARSNIPAADSAKNEFGVTACLSVYGDDAWFATASQAKEFHPRVYHTTDRGMSWTVSHPIDGLTGIAVSIEFEDESNGIVVDNLGGKWARTTDGGSSWNVRDIGKLLWLRDMKEIPGTFSLMICGGEPDSGYVYELSAGDSSWRALRLPPGTKRVRSIAFGSPGQGWGVGGGGDIIKWTSIRKSDR